MSKPPAKWKHPKTQLTDLNYDCLCEIFGYLNIDDLDQVSKISDSFKSVADRIVSRKFDIETINTYDEMRNLVNGPKRILEISGNLLEIVELPSLHRYQNTKDLRLFDLWITDNEAEKLFKAMIHLEAVEIRYCQYLTGIICLKPLKNLKSVQLYGYGWYELEFKMETQTEQEVKSFLKRNQSIEVLKFDCPFFKNCANEIAELPNLHTYCHGGMRNSPDVAWLKVARMTSLRKVSYEMENEEFLEQINATNVVEELEIYGFLSEVPTFPQNSNIKVLKFGDIHWICIESTFLMDNLEQLSLNIMYLCKNLALNFILTLIKNLPKLNKLELKFQFNVWEQPHDKIEKILRLENRKLKICVAEKLKTLIEWPPSDDETCLQFMYIQDWNEIKSEFINFYD